MLEIWVGSAASVLLVFPALAVRNEPGTVECGLSVDGEIREPAWSR